MKRKQKETAEQYLERIPSFAKKKSGMEDVRAFLELLGSPDRGMKIFHVAGTNGKGSVCAFLSSALKEAGLTVPDDISVAGFDGIDAGEYYIPSITTIRQPVEQLAAETAKMLFSLISGKEEPCSKVYDGELVVRESTKSRIAQQ